MYISVGEATASLLRIKKVVSRHYRAGKINSSAPHGECLIRAHPAISHCSHLLLKCRVATNISNWPKVHSRWFKNYIFAKSCILISWFSNIAFIIPSLFTIVPYFTLWIFSIPSGCQTVWIQIRLDILSGLYWTQTVCKGYQQITSCH